MLCKTFENDISRKTEELDHCTFHLLSLPLFFTVNKFYIFQNEVV